MLRRVDAGKVRDWPPGVDTTMFAPSPQERIDSKPFTFITAGSLIPVKGHELLLRSLAELRAQLPEQDVRLRIVGDGPLKPVLEKLAGNLELAGYVAFDGGVPHEVLPAIYNNADAFLLGSWHESQCMAALEAMASGLPWVGPPVGALADVALMAEVQPAGIIFKARDPRQVAAAMRSLVELSQAERLAYGVAARNVIENNYDMVTQAARFLQLIDQLTEGQ